MTDIKDFGRTSFVRHTTGLKERLEKCTMINQLFKLKKDGKAVGYLQFAKYSNNDLHIQVRSDDSEWDDDIDLIDYNSIHPFVTKDKNGKDVFADDRIKRVPYEGDPNPKPYQTEGRTGIIAWHHGFLQWCFLDDRTHHLDGLVDSEIFETGIELIEDKE